MKIDVSRALKALGIKHDVRFRFEDLSGNVQMNGLDPRHVCPAAISPMDPFTIKLDPHALRICAEHGDTIEDSVAHELVHVAQFQEYGSPIEIATAYQDESARNGYFGNRFEREAERLAPAIARLITVMP